MKKPSFPPKIARIIEHLRWECDLLYDDDREFDSGAINQLTDWLDHYLCECIECPVCDGWEVMPDTPHEVYIEGGGVKCVACVDNPHRGKEYWCPYCRETDKAWNDIKISGTVSYLKRAVKKGAKNAN